jgi:hypothetical protein
MNREIFISLAKKYMKAKNSGLKYRMREVMDLAQSLQDKPSVNHHISGL